MSHIDPGPLATYESLADPHLTGYFNNSRMRKHLRKMGLITSRGNIVSEKVFRLNNSRKEHQRHIRDVLAQAIIHKALDMERHRQMHIKKQLEEIGKIERVRRVRAERALRGDEDLLPLLSPRMKHSKDNKHGKKSKGKVPILQTVTDSDDYQQQPPQSVGYPAIPSDTPYNTRTDRMKTQYPNVEVDNQHLYELDRDALRSFTLNLSQFDLGSGVSPYSVPPLDKPSKKKERRRPATATGTGARVSIKAPRPRSNARSLKLHRREPPMMHRAQLHTLARVTFKYLGQMVHLDHEEEDPRDEVVVMQQHCGGENLRVFKGMLMKGDKFVIISRRHRTFPFSLTFYLNGVQVERLSTCCEYKHKRGHKLGARSSHFGIIKVEGSQACFKCLIAQGKLKTRPDPTPPPTGKPSKPTQPRRRAKKLRGVDEQRPEEYADDFHTSSKSSTSEDVQTDGPKLASDESSSELSDTESESTISDVSDSDSHHSDSESRLSSLKPDDDISSASSSDSEDSHRKGKQKRKTKSGGKTTSVRSSKSPSPPKERIKSPVPSSDRIKSPVGHERVKSPVENSRSTPSPVQQVTKSLHPVQGIEKSSSSSSNSGKDDLKGTSASESLSSMSSSDSGDTVEEVTKPMPSKTTEEEPIKPLSHEVNSNNSNNITETESGEKPAKGIPVNDDKPTNDSDRPKTPEPESSSSSSSSESDSSAAESIKSKSSDVEKGSKDANQKEKTGSTSILSFVKGKAHVDLSKRTISKDQVEELTDFLNKDPSTLGIQTFTLKNCDVGNEGGKAILNSLLKAKSLKSLDLSGNNMNEECVESLLDVCQKNPVDHLSIANNPLGDNGCEELVSGFTRSQETVVTAQIQKRVSQSLIASVLKDSRKELGDESGAGLSSASSMSSLASTAVSETVFLQNLNISNTNAGHATFISLGSYLGLNPKLATLDLSGNSISTTALESLINSLGDGTNKNLKTLHMNNTTMDDRHAGLLAEKLTNNCRLFELSLKGNRITKDGMERLEDYKNNNKSLETLILE